MFPFPRPNPFYMRAPVAPMPQRRRRPRGPGLAAQVQSLTNAISALVMGQARGPAAKPAPPRRKRVVKKKQTNQQSNQPQKKKQQPKKKPQADKKKSKVKPGKRQRMAMKFEADKIFPVKDEDGKTLGYAVAVEDKVMKPLHVKGIIDHPALAKLKFTKSSMYDMEFAKLPTNMRSDSFKYTTERPEGFYNWHHGAVQYTGGRFSIPTGSGNPGDSGRPILDNSGRVVAIVLGGSNQGSRTELSVITWGKSGKADLTEPEGTVKWSAATTLCIFANMTFMCMFPPTCYDKEPAKALTILEENVDNPAYDDLLFGILRCGSRRPKRSTELNNYHLSAPYVSFCPECDYSHQCHSPVAIEHVWSDSDDGTIRIQSSMQFGLDENGTTNVNKVRFALQRKEHGYADSHINSLTISTSSTCKIGGYKGYFLQAKCPPGDSVTLRVRLNNGFHSCTVRKRVSYGNIGNEKFQHPPHYGKKLPCHTYQHLQNDGDDYIFMHRQGPHAHKDFVSEEGGKVYIVPPNGQTLEYECNCTSPTSGTTNTRKEVDGCKKSSQCVAFLRDNTKWVYQSQYLRRADDSNAKGKLHMPFPLIRGECIVPLAREPIVEHMYKSIKLRLFADNPTLLRARTLNAEPELTEKWITGTADVTLAVPLEGIEYTWGNHDPVRLYALESSEGDPHGLPHEALIYHFNENPVWTVVIGVGLVTAAVTAVSLTACLCSKARQTCLTPYMLAPNARVPTLLALLCCIRTAKAATFAETMTYMWENNQYMFWCQLLIPLAAIITIIRCCGFALPFLLVAGASVRTVGAYEHSVNVPNNIYSPFKAVVDRPGYSPYPLSITVLESQIIPALDLQYITCKYRTVVPSPHIKCCGNLECKYVNKPDYRCKIFSGVYPFMWGGAQCFCESENTQMSEAYVDRSPDCKTLNAKAYRAHTANFKAKLNITFGDKYEVVEAFANGVTKVNAGQLTAVLGPMASPWSPFDNKIVLYKDKVYNYDFPEYGAGLPGAFGDIQMMSPTSADLYARTNLKLLRPNSGQIHVPYTQAPSGFVHWTNNSGKSLQDTAPFGCNIKTNPIRAENCAVGSIPVSLDIPDAEFTRVSEAPHITSASCTITSCTSSTEAGGVIHIEYKAAKPGKCAVQALSSVVTITESNADIRTEGTLELHFSTAAIQADFRVLVCASGVQCTGPCRPPKEHIVAKPQLTTKEFKNAISSTSWNWVYALLGSTSSLLLVGVIIFFLIYMVSAPRKG
ncbi:structural polyprotein [Trocara virus]|uniref:Structural polyprotein n=1 Tax=Trocara virus TaxID=135246 RepID=H6SU05_9VIRU|nr:structural polyprotein [Trocara virus]AEJ36235.1 structural polyprotein [Trocara virus]